MITLLSPAKSLDYSTAIPLRIQPTTIPFAEDSNYLMQELKRLKVTDIVGLMKVNVNIALLNYERFQTWYYPFTEENARAAAYVFNGEAYRGLDAYSMSAQDLAFAQQHLCILSGLYGVLRPMDAIMPYRLEMGTRLKTEKGNNLYAFWGGKIAQLIETYLKQTATDVIVNLSSAEYFKVVEKHLQGHKIITPIFMQLKGDSYKQIVVYAKKARGMMSRYIINNRIEQVEDIKTFDVAGYAFHQQLSTDTKWVFTR